MRTDEDIAAAIQDPDDVRSLLLSATDGEMAGLRELVVPTDRRAGVDRIAAVIERRIEDGLPGGADALAPLFRLAAWAAKRLGSTAKPHELSEADREIVRLSKNGAGSATSGGPELRFPEGGDTTLLQIAVALARLRHRKARRLRWWRPLLDRLVGHPTAPAPAPAGAPPRRRESRELAETGQDSDALWDVIRSAGGRLPLSVWEEKLNEARKAIGRFNIIVAGRTGVGKTTLIGAIFGEEVGNTLMGRPRTRGRIWYPVSPGEADILRLCDTEGLEMERYKETLDGLKREIETRNASSDPFDHIHVAWLCIDEPSLTVQPGEEALVEMLTREGIPVIAVLTKAGMAPAFKQTVEKLLPGAKAVIRVRAQPIVMEGQHFAQMGLNELMQATEEAIPTAVEAAWHVASRNLEAMLRRCETIVKRAAAAAGAVGATPIPLVDAAGVFGVQVGMIVAISLNMGVKLKRSDLQAMAVTLLGALGLTAGGRFIAGQFAKLIPGLGTIAGSAITGTTAAALTYGLGRAYLEYLGGFFERNKRMPDADELVSGFRDFWRRWKNKEEAPPDTPKP
jgi:uncharacterized protein (DUF697 family)/GTP-binding protein EngB required for normal cell division